MFFQHNFDTIELQHISCDETYPAFSDSENEQTDIKEEADPLLITCPLTETENEVSLSLNMWSYCDILVCNILFIQFSEFVL
jgi:hypothetical protein